MKLDPRLLRLVRSTRLLFVLTVLLGFGVGISTVFQARLLATSIRRVFLNGAGLVDIRSILYTLVALVMLRAALAWASEVSAHSISARIKASLRSRLYDHLLALGLDFLHNGDGTGEEETHTGTLTNTMVEGIEALDAYYSQYLPQLALAALIPLTILAFVFPLDLLSALVLLLTAPLIPFFMALIGSAADSLTRRQWLTLSRMSAYFLDVMQGLVTLKILGRSREQAAVIEKVGERFRQRTMEVLRVTFLSALALEMLATISTAIVAVEIGLRLLYGRIGFEQALFILIIAPEFYLPLRLLGTRFHAGMAGVTAAGSIFALLDQPVAHASGNVPAPTAPLDICFEEVSYTYPGDRPALCSVSLSIEPGEKVALVGSSGAGKTTLSRLVLGFLHPQAGRILVNGLPLDQLEPESWRSRLAWVPQEPYLFNDTVLDNIRLGKPDASLAEVEQSARQANAHEFIQALPQGYHTMIGERGAHLSGGQAQRIALARAFLKNAPVLILDEPTSHLDPATEAAFHAAIRRLMEGRTALIIAHRQSTLGLANRVIRLEAGRQLESGGPDMPSGRGGLNRVERRDLKESIREEHTHPASGSGQVFTHTTSHPLNTPKDPVSLPESGKNSHPQNIGRHPGIRLLSFLQPFAGWVTLSVFLGFCTIASGIGLMAASAFIISSAALQPSIAFLAVPIVGVRFFGITRGVFRYGERYVSHQVTFRLLSRLRVWFYQAVEPLAPARLTQYRSGDLLTRALADIASLENFYVRAAAPPLVAVLVTAAVGFYLASFAPVFGLTSTAFLLLAGAGVPLLARILSRRPGQAVISARACLQSVLVDGIQGMADLAAFGQSQRQARLMQAATTELALAQRALAWLSGFQSALEILLSNLGAVAVLALSVPLVRSGQIDGVYIAVVVLAALAAFEAVQPLPAAAQHLESSFRAAQRLFELADAPPPIKQPLQPDVLPEQFDLQVSGLSFAYPGNETSRVLEDISFHLYPGRQVAVVGPSGAGKSTLVSLLLRFWEYSGGQICLAGRDVRQFDANELRKCVAVVAQSTFLFSATLRENLLLARPDAAPADLEWALHLSQLDELLSSLPKGLDTWLGEQGYCLSGGERQRLAIARAFLKDAPLLILDEPTAHLDPLTETKVLDAIHTLMRGRSTLWITHRLDTLQEMDEIIVLQQGRVIERGRHDLLIAQDGLYNTLWNQQTERGESVLN